MLLSDPLLLLVDQIAEEAAKICASAPPNHQLQRNQPVHRADGDILALAEVGLFLGYIRHVLYLPFSLMPL